MKTVGIVTFTNGQNYGQRLQNLAVTKYFETRGYKVFTLITNPVSYYTIKGRIKKYIKRLFKSFKDRKKEKSFDIFNEKYISFYPHHLIPGKKFKYEDFFDIFVAGSDQIWNPFSPLVNSVYFLKFTCKEKKYSFAASFSVDELPIEKRNQYKMYLSDFKFLSVREEKGKEIIKNLSAGEADVILDPTLLFDIDFWNSISRKPSRKLPSNYIVLYFLGNLQDKQLIYSWAKDKGYTVIDFINDSKWYSVAPDEWLYIIRNSKMIFTDSYHGTIFSIIFKKNFRVFSRICNGFTMNSRFQTLFNLLDINLKDVYSRDFNSSLDLETSYKKLQFQRSRCLELLDKFFPDINEVEIK